MVFLSMIGNENGFVTFLKKDVPNLVGAHYIAHSEALAASDASKCILELLFVEKLANLLFYNNLCNLKLFMLFKSMDLDGFQGDKLLKGLLY